MLQDVEKPILNMGFQEILCYLFFFHLYPTEENKYLTFPLMIQKWLIMNLGHWVFVLFYILNWRNNLKLNTSTVGHSFHAVNVKVTTF